MRIIVIVLGIGLSVFAAWAIFETVTRPDTEEYVAEMILCAGGVLMYWFSDEFSSWSGRYGMTHDAFYTRPESYFKLGGIILTGICGYLLLSGGHLE